MKCEEFRENIAEISETETENSKFREHPESCDKCADYASDYMAVLAALTPSNEIKAPKHLKKNIMKAVAELKQNQKAHRPRMLVRLVSGIAASAAIVLVTAVSLFSVTAEARASGSQFEAALAGMGEVTSVVMELQVRVEPGDGPFYSIDPTADFITFRVTSILGSSPKWRVEKQGGRTAVYDGSRTYVWYSDGRSGTVQTGQSLGAIEWFAYMVDPRILLQAEQNRSKRDRRSHYSIEETANEVKLVINEKAKGNYEGINRGDLNSSIEDSDNHREYIFTKGDNLLREGRLYVRIQGGGETEVIRLKSVSYNTPGDLSAIAEVPAGVVWKNLSLTPKSELFSSIGADQAVRMFFNALNSGDIKSVEDFMHYFTERQIATIASKYSGAVITEMGKVKKQRTYAGVYVPCRITMADGSVEEIRIAVRNDNPNRVWLLDGGI